MLDRIVNREDTDQTVSLDAALSGSVQFVYAFLAGNKYSKFLNIYRTYDIKSKC